MMLRWQARSNAARDIPVQNFCHCSVEKKTTKKAKKKKKIESLLSLFRVDIFVNHNIAAVVILVSERLLRGYGLLSLSLQLHVRCSSVECNLDTLLICSNSIVVLWFASLCSLFQETRQRPRNHLHLHIQDVLSRQMTGAILAQRKTVCLRFSNSSGQHYLGCTCHNTGTKLIWLGAFFLHRP